jgi:hypothetical protein
LLTKRVPTRSAWLRLLSLALLAPTGERSIWRFNNRHDVDSYSLAIPGVGPVVAAGWLAATAAGALAGGATGGIIGALSQAGVSKEDAPVYAEGLRRGGTMVTARVPDGERTRFESILNHSAVNIRERGEAYRKSGWTGFDEKAKPYSADEVRRERTTYQPSDMR